MKKKNGLVLFPCDAATQQRLLAETGEFCNFAFREERWTAQQYRDALKTAHILIGEPRNEDFAFCERERSKQVQCQDMLWKWKFRPRSKAEE